MKVSSGWTVGDITQDIYMDFDSRESTDVNIVMKLIERSIGLQENAMDEDEPEVIETTYIGGIKTTKPDE